MNLFEKALGAQTRWSSFENLGEASKLPSVGIAFLKKCGERDCDAYNSRSSGRRSGQRLVILEIPDEHSEHCAANR
jgi:hypothetical protein